MENREIVWNDWCDADSDKASDDRENVEDEDFQDENPQVLQIVDYDENENSPERDNSSEREIPDHGLIGLGPDFGIEMPGSPQQSESGEAQEDQLQTLLLPSTTMQDDPSTPNPDTDLYTSPIDRQSQQDSAIVVNDFLNDSFNENVNQENRRKFYETKSQQKKLEKFYAQTVLSPQDFFSPAPDPIKKNLAGSSKKSSESPFRKLYPQSDTKNLTRPFGLVETPTEALHNDYDTYRNRYLESKIERMSVENNMNALLNRVNLLEREEEKL